MNRPKTSDLKSLKTTYSHLLRPKKQGSMSDLSMSFHVISTKFTRKKFKEDAERDMNTETAYNTRSGVLNPAGAQSRKPGGNGYCNILRQKRQIAEVFERETELDRRIRGAKLCRLEENSHYTNSLADLCSTAFVTMGKADTQERPHLINPPKPPKRASMTDVPRSTEVPSFFKSAAVQCLCNASLPCTCGKRLLGGKTKAEHDGIRSKIDGILTNCERVEREGEGARTVMKEQMEEVRKVMQLFSRHTKVIMRNIQRSKSYDLRRKFQVATRYHDLVQPLPIMIPGDVEDIAALNPSLFPPLA